MPSPSPARNERKEQLLMWQQQREANKAKSPTTKPEDRQRKRSSNMQAMSATSPERKQSTTATYTEQFLRRRRSQQDPRDEQQRQSPRARRSREDADGATELLNGLEPLPQPEADEKLENGHQENGLHESVADADTTVENEPLRTTDLIEDVDIVASAVGSGKGIPATTDESFGMIDQSAAVTRVMMTKKRKAPCGRSDVTLAVVAGVVTITAAGGIVICRMYPSSPAAIWIRFVASRAEEGLYTLLEEFRNEVGPYAKHLGEVAWTKWLALLLNRGLTNTARAAEVLVDEELRGSPGLTQAAAVASMSFKFMEDISSQLRLAVLASADALKWSMDWIQSHVQAVSKLIELELGGEKELLNRARSFLLVVLSSLREALKRSGEWTTSSLDHVLEWTGLKSNVSDASPLNDQFFAPLETNQAAIQKIGRELTVQESEALQDVKRFEKRRVTIASDTTAILAETRNFALESVISVKMASLELIEHRLKQLEEQYARSFDQALKDYERTSRQVEQEGGDEMLAEIAVESQVHVDAAAALIRNLAVQEKTVDEIPAVIEGQNLFKDEPRDATDDQAHSDVRLAEEGRLVEELPDSPVPTAQDTTPEEVPDVNVDKMEDAQIVSELIKEGLMTSEHTEAPVVERGSSEKALSKSERVTEEQAQIVADLIEKSQLTAEHSVPVEEKPNPSQDVPVGGHGSDQVHITAKMTEENLLTADLESTDKGVSTGEVKETLITEVLVDLNSAVLKMEHTQVEVTKLLEAQNLSEADISKPEVELQQGDRFKAHFKVPVDGADLEFEMTVDQVIVDGTEQVEVERGLPDLRTRAAIHPRSEKGDDIEQQKRLKSELTQEEEHVQVHEDLFLADDTKTKVHNEQMDAETVLKVEKNVYEAEAVVAELLRIEKSDLFVVLSHDEAAAEKETQEDVGGVVDKARQEHKDVVRLEEEANAAILSGRERLETEDVVVAKEIQELELLEQVLMQEESERVRVEEELRVIAEKEEIWLRSKRVPAEGEFSQEDAMTEQQSTATIDGTESAEVSADLKSDGRLGIPISAISRPALIQIGLLSVAFLGLAGLAAYLLVWYRKRGLFDHPPHRRKRWQRLADMDESDAEEVVLLPDDSSDEDDDTDVDAPKESRSEVVELRYNVDVKATTMLSSDGKEAEETTTDHERVVEQEEVIEEEVTTSQTVVVERVQTTMYTVDQPATPTSEALADDSDTVNAPVFTPPALKQETPDTSQRTSRRRQIRT